MCVEGSAGVDGVVAKDSQRGVLCAVFGRYRGGSGPVLIRFSGLGPTYQRAKVVAERIANSEAQALAAPARTIDGVFAIRKGLLEVVLNDLGMFDAYALTISLAAKPDIEEPTAQNVDRE